MRLSRLMIAGTGSGCGKTTITCGMLRLLQQQGLKMAAFKCGPDYIDPLYHREVLGVASRNLDSFFSSERELEQELERGGLGCDAALIEGVMGYYDGLGTGKRTSCAEIADLTHTPVILVLDAAGRSSSVLAELQGFLNYRPEGRWIRGVIFNRLSPVLYNEMAQQAQRMGVRPCGYLSKDERHRFESRHLGLMMPSERADFQKEADALAAGIKAGIDMKAVLSIADSAEDLTEDTGELQLSAGENHADSGFSAAARASDGRAPRIALARDAAFCFYYPQNTEYLERLGCRIILFSPMEDRELPDCDGLILPGGYPELYAKQLSDNVTMRESVRRAVSKGLPTIAECGGFLYLHERLEDQSGSCYPMAGVISASCRYAGFQRQFGYVTMTTGKDSVLGSAGTACRGHEFHYYVSDAPGENTLCAKPDGRRNWRGNILSASLYAGFTHLWLPSGPEAAVSFVNACRKGQNLWND